MAVAVLIASALHRVVAPDVFSFLSLHNVVKSATQTCFACVLVADVLDVLAVPSVPIAPTVSIRTDALSPRVVRQRVLLVAALVFGPVAVVVVAAVLSVLSLILLYFLKLLSVCSTP